MTEAAQDPALAGASIVEPSAGGWTDLSSHPFRRWVARQFDFWITTGLVFVALALPFVMLASNSEAATIPVGLLVLVFLLSPLRGLVTAALNALMLSRFSTTPGKWLGGVRIRRKDGAPLTFGLAFKRELAALTFGCGLYIPLIALFAMGYGFFRLRAKGATSWDEDRGLAAVQRPNSLAQAALIVAALVPLGVVALMLALAGYLIEAKRAAGGG